MGVPAFSLRDPDGDIEDEISTGLEDAPPVFQRRGRIGRVFQGVRRVDKIERRVLQVAKMKSVAVFDDPRTAVGGQQIAPVANIEAEALAVSFEESFADAAVARNPAPNPFRRKFRAPVFKPKA
jgi:hypothetical protein